MPNYYEAEIKQLEEMGCPIDFELFAELREAEKKLTPRPEAGETVDETDLGGGLSVSISIRMGPDEEGRVRSISATSSRNTGRLGQRST